MTPSRALAALLALSLPAGLAACGDSGKKPAPGTAGSAPEKKKEPERPRLVMPKYDKSGIFEDVRKLQAKREEVKSGTREEKEKARGEMDALLKDMETKWATKPVPDPEAYLLAVVQHEFLKKPADAVASCRRYLAIPAAVDDKNYANAQLLLLRALVASGDLDGAEVELARARTGGLGAQVSVLQQAELSTAQAMEKAGRFESAAKHYLAAFDSGTPDPESVVFAADCFQRAGKPAEAVAAGRKGQEALKGSPKEARMRYLVAACEMVGREAPGFAAAKHWKGSGGPVDLAAAKGKVVLVFGWKTEFNEGLLKGWAGRLRKLGDAYEDRVQFVGISRLQKFDPRIGGYNKDLTQEEELDFYDAYERQYALRFPLAVGGLDDTSLMDAWCSVVVPSFVIVGKDGRVAYARTGFSDEHFDAVRAELDKAIAK